MPRTIVDNRLINLARRLHVSFSLRNGRRHPAIVPRVKTIDRSRNFLHGIVDIPQAQLEEVDQYCVRMNISRAEAVRRAIQAYLARPDAAHPDGFGLWATLGAEPAVASPRKRRP